MRPGQASVTAQRVAAYRLTFDREPAAFGDPGADERLARDVAGSAMVDLEGMMVPYLRARTTFFDRVVVRSLDAGLSQVVIAAAGYDGRALRYAKPGVRWFEVDHPDTQRDKLERFDRLGIAVDAITFVAADFAIDDVAAALQAAGHDAHEPTLFLCEGVAVYLDVDVLESLLRALRARADDKSRLAISLSVDAASDELAARRRAFRERVAAVGEPTRTILTVDSAGALFSSARWRMGEGSEQARHAGLVVAVPEPVVAVPEKASGPER